MRNRGRSEPAKAARMSTPTKPPHYHKPLETQAYRFVWIFFYLFMLGCVLSGIFARIAHTFCFGEYPDRKALQTFTQFKLINRYMLFWPIIFAFSSYFTTTKDENGNDVGKLYRKSLRLNVIVQVVMCFVFYYSIYYTTEIMKSTIQEEVMSGHIFTGLLASSSIVSTTVFTHHFRDRNLQTHKIVEFIAFLFVFHMGYSFFWTSFVYHHVFDTYFALVVGGIVSFFIQ